MSVSVLDGDCLLVMPAMGAESVDAIVSDPPYGLRFMGKAWDHGIPGEAFWREALRVAKPGAHLVAFGGTRTFHRLTCAIEDAGWEIRDCLSWLYGSGFPKSHNGPWGGTALKPAWEPIILARKPLGGTVASNHAEHGTGALNIDGCRIGTESRPVMVRTPTIVGANSMAGESTGATSSGDSTTLGRWPANVVLDEHAAAMLDAQSGECEGPGGPATKGSATAWPGGAVQGRIYPKETGGASRFFYTAKASRSERNAGLDGMAQRRVGMMQDDGYEWKGDANHAPHKTPAAPNHHPTVKPLDLMQWLCRLVTPKGGTILDPFCGSGSTGRAAIAEGFSFVGIELEPEYAEIARARIRDYAPLFDADGAA